MYKRCKIDATTLVTRILEARNHKWLWQISLNRTIIIVLKERSTRGDHTVDYITCQFVHIIDFTLLALTRHNCLTQDFTDMSDTCKGCEKRSIFALKRHQRAEQAWHWRISAQLCLSELGSPWPTSPLNDCEECPLWMPAILHLMLAGDTRVSECQKENSPPHVEAHSTTLGQKLGLQRTHTARAVADWLDLVSVSHEIGNYQGHFWWQVIVYMSLAPLEDGEQKQFFDEALWLTFPQTFTKFQLSADKHKVWPQLRSHNILNWSFLV